MGRLTGKSCIVTGAASGALPPNCSPPRAAMCWRLIVPDPT